MAVYRQKYEEWFNALSDAEREAETARLNSNKTVRKPAPVKIKQEPKQQQQQQQQQTITLNQGLPQQINLASLVKYISELLYGIYCVCKSDDVESKWIFHHVFKFKGKYLCMDAVFKVLKRELYSYVEWFMVITIYYYLVPLIY